MEQPTLTNCATPELGNALADSALLGDIRRVATEYEGIRPLYASSLGSCAYRLWRDISGYEAEPIDEKGLQIVTIGTAVHDKIETLQTATDEERKQVNELAEERYGRESVFGSFPNIVFEHPTTDTRFTIGDPPYVTGRYDVAVTADYAAEFKTASSYKVIQMHRWIENPQAATWGRPDLRHMIQVGVAALSLGLEECRIVYQAKENFMPSDRNRFRKDFGYGIEEKPYGGLIVEFKWSIAEGTQERAQLDFALKRAKSIYDLAVKGEPAPRQIFETHNKARVVGLILNRDDAVRGWLEHREGDTIISAQETWECGYCPHQAACIEELGEPKARRKNQTKGDQK